MSKTTVGTRIFFRDIGYRNKHLPPVLADIFSRRSRIFFRVIINPYPSVYARLSGRLSYATLMLRGSLGRRGCCMAKESEEAGFGQSSAGEGEPPDTHAEKHLRKFLHDLGRLSTQYGLWIENTPLGTTVSQRADALGYHAWARAGGDQARVYELDCHGTGDAYVVDGHTLDGRHVVIGGDQARSRPTGSGPEETASTRDTVQAALNKLLHGLEPEKLSFYPLDPVGHQVPHQACYAGRPIPGLIFGIADDGSHCMQALQILQQMRRSGELASFLGESARLSGS